MDAEGTLDPWNARGTQEGRRSKERGRVGDGTETGRSRSRHKNEKNEKTEKKSKKQEKKNGKIF
jgi:hypothetical protein